MLGEYPQSESLDLKLYTDLGFQIKTALSELEQKFPRLSEMIATLYEQLIPEAIKYASIHILIGSTPPRSITQLDFAEKFSVLGLAQLLEKSHFDTIQDVLKAVAKYLGYFQKNNAEQQLVKDWIDKLYNIKIEF